MSLLDYMLPGLAGLQLLTGIGGLFGGASAARRQRQLYAQQVDALQKAMQMQQQSFQNQQMLQQQQLAMRQAMLDPSFLTSRAQGLYQPLSDIETAAMLRNLDAVLGPRGLGDSAVRTNLAQQAMGESSGQRWLQAIQQAMGMIGMANQTPIPSLSSPGLPGVQAPEVPGGAGIGQSVQTLALWDLLRRMPGGGQIADTSFIGEQPLGPSTTVPTSMGGGVGFG